MLNFVVSFLAVILQTQSMATPISIPKVDVAGLVFSKEPGPDIAEPKGDWAKSSLPIRLFLEDGPVLAGENFSAKAGLAWSTQALLLRVDVIVLHPNESDDTDNLFNGDSIEFFFRQPGTALDMFQVVVSPGITAEHPAARVHFFDYRAGPPHENAASAVFVARERTPQGYRMTIGLPWSLIKVDPKQGELVGTRFTVNHQEPGFARSRLTWTGNEETNEFWTPQVVKLDHVAGVLKPLRAWMTWDSDLLNGKVFVTANPELAGQSVGITWGDHSKSAVKLDLDGARSTAQFGLEGPPAGGSEANPEITIGDQTLKVSTPDIKALRVARFLSGGATGGRQRADHRLVPTLLPGVFAGPKFPEVDYPDRSYAEKLVGPITVKATYYDAAGNEVSRGNHPGRYVAKIDVSASSATFTTYRTLFRKPDDWQGEASNPVVAAAAFEGKLRPGSRPDAARKAEQDTTHAIRKRIGAQVKYEYAVKTPTDYQPAAGRKWPLIVYLHGSGGGDDASWPNTRLTDGPMGTAHRLDNFPFVVVALRSRGGWFPPAVEDVIDEVESKFEIDKSRIYLTGFSMGGFGTWNTAYDQPGRFAAIAPVAAGSGDHALMPLLVQLPAWVFNGGADNTTPPRLARGAVELLKSAGGNVRYTEYPDMGHTDALRLAYAEAELYTWFLQFHTKL